jgi:hypothetical protein
VTDRDYRDFFFFGVFAGDEMAAFVFDDEDSVGF